MDLFRYITVGLAVAFQKILRAPKNTEFVLIKTQNYVMVPFLVLFSKFSCPHLS